MLLKSRFEATVSTCAIAIAALAGCAAAAIASLAVVTCRPALGGPSPELSTARDLSTAIALYNSKRYSEAQKSFEFLARGQADPTRARTAYYYLACCYYQRGQLPQAATLLRNLVQSAPQSQEGKMAASLLAIMEKAGGISASGASTSTTSPALAADAEFSSLPAKVVIPFKMVGNGLLEFEMMYDGARMKGRLDTGIYGNLSLANLRRIGLREPGPIPDGKTFGWNGVPLRVWHVKARVKVGDLTRTIAIELEDSNDEKAYLGMALLKGYSYEIDWSRQQIVLYKTLPADLMVSSGKEIPLLDEYGIDNVMVGMNGHQIRCRISTALDVTTINKETAKLIGAKAQKEKNEILGIGGAAVLDVAKADVSLGPLNLKDLEIQVADEGPASIGLNVIKNRHYVVDRQKNVLRFLK